MNVEVPALHNRRVALLTAALIVTVVLAAPPESSLAFELDTHRSIVTQAFTPPAGAPGVDAAALSEIIGSIWSGRGNLGSDQHQFDEFRHFDNAAGPVDVCTRATDAWAAFWPSILAGAHPNPTSAAFTGFLDAPGARSAFGALTHSFQDFYSHSNWIELAIAANQSPTLAPLFPTCNPSALPAGLHTGYFKITIKDPLSGCPNDGLGPPPAPFTECHFGLNKDSLAGHGGAAVPGLPGLTFHALAVNVAVQATIAAYTLVRQQLEAAFSPAADDASGSCLAAALFQASTQVSCLDLSGAWSVSTTDDLVNGWQVGDELAFAQTSSTDVSIVRQSIAGCGALTGLVARTASAVTTFDGAMNACLDPTTPSGGCPAEIALPFGFTYWGPKILHAVLTVIDVDVDPGKNCPKLGQHDIHYTLERVP